MPEKRAARNWPRWLVYFTAFVMVAAVALTIIPYLYLPVAAGGPAQRDFSDYAIMLQYYPSGARLGMPTLQEFKRLLKLWPTVPPAQNAALYYLKGTSLLRRRGAPDGSATTYFDHPYAGDLAALEKWIADNKEALDQVLAGNRLKVCTFPPFGASRPGSLGSIEYLAYMRQAARVMADADFIEEMKGNSGAWPQLKAKLPLLAAALPFVGHFQTRNKGTRCAARSRMPIRARKSRWRSRSPAARWCCARKNGASACSRPMRFRWTC